MVRPPYQEDFGSLHPLLTRRKICGWGLTGNVTAIFFRNSTLEDKKRTGYLSIVNIMPFVLIGRPNMLVDSSGRVPQVAGPHGFERIAFDKPD